MNAIIKSIAFGVGAYVASAVGLWFVLSYILFPLMPTTVWLLPAVITLIPLLLSGYVAARFAISNHRARRISIGVIAGLIGFGFSLVLTQTQGEVWFFLLFILGAAVVAAAGSFIGARQNMSGRTHR